jgi:hypothetical protein
MEVIVASANEECTICLKVGELANICAEDHKFCGECLVEYIKVQIERFVVEQMQD